MLAVFHTAVIAGGGTQILPGALGLAEKRELTDESSLIVFQKRTNVDDTHASMLYLKRMDR